MSQKTKDIITIGFALFAMFFGAGNLLLPPYIGMQIGDHVWITILAFGLSGILLPFFGLLAVVNSGDRFEDLASRVHPWLSPILGTIIILCIGPLIAIPRTAATTHEVGVAPNIPSVSAIWSSILFFALTWSLTIRPSRVVDTIGNILTPILLVLLIFLVSLGIWAPISNYSDSLLTASESFTLGFVEGYQTLDVLASVIFAGIIIAASKTKGYHSIKSKNQVVISAGILAAIALFVIYGGLIYLGATAGIADLEIKRSELLIRISKSIMGPYGTIGISVAIALACLTTAVALVSATGAFFENLSKGRLRYKLLVTLCCIFSCTLSITGVDNIISFAYPILTFVYPIAITLVLYTVFFGRIVRLKAPYVAALLGSTVIGVFSLLKQLQWVGSDLLEKLNHIPFFQYELGWVVPSLLLFFGTWALCRGDRNPRSQG
ncbi:MAG: branched-chain amino acid transport system II carrier protein [Sphingobacterium sp.]